MADIWIDTDIGDDIDDTVALWAAARHPRLRLVGVSTVYGPVVGRAWLAAELLSRLGCHAPVLPGASHPLGGREPGTEPVSYLRLVPPEVYRSEPVADEAMVSLIAQAMLALNRPFHLVTIGATTNAARLARDHPEVRERWLSVICMAGRLEGEAEYNVHCDYEAARMVFEQLSPRVVGMEACSYALPRAEVEAALPRHDAASFFLDCYREYRAYAEWAGADPEQRPLTLFDPITVLSLVCPRAFDFQSLRVLVEGEGRLRLTDDGAEVRYALSGKWSRLKPVITRLLGSDAPRAGASRRP